MYLGHQKKPIKGVHNSRWVQSPGKFIMSDLTPSRIKQVKTYVQTVIRTFKDDARVLAWDLWNEPDNLNNGLFDEVPNKLELVERLLPQVFAWAREMKPRQPLTSAVWDPRNFFTNINQMQLTLSDVISFHHYGGPISFRILSYLLSFYGRPLFCTEWLARSQGSTVGAILPVAKQNKIAMGFNAPDIFHCSPAAQPEFATKCGS